MIDDDPVDLDVPDDALQEIKDLAPDLSGQELIYVYWRSLAVPPGESYKRAGYEGRGYRVMDRRPAIRQAMVDLQEQLEPDYKVTRKRVQGVILEAIEMARRKDQPKVMIEGAVALAEIGGVKAPTKLQIQQHTVQENVLPGAQPRQLQLTQMSRHELEAELGRVRVLPQPVARVEVSASSVDAIDAEWEEAK